MLNSLLHKDNIGPNEYAFVKRIRRNTLAFKLLDPSTQPAVQLGIADYSFDDLYLLIGQRRRCLFWVKGLDDYEGVIIYQYHSMPDKYDASGVLMEQSYTSSNALWSLHHVDIMLQLDTMQQFIPLPKSMKSS